MSRRRAVERGRGMGSEAQIRANHENAKHSTGPRTPEGKQRVALNALKHGLTGKQVVLYNEKAEDFDAFRDALWEDIEPQGMLEGVLVDKIVADAWRLRRVPLFEATLHSSIKEERDLSAINKKLKELREAATAGANARVSEASKPGVHSRGDDDRRIFEAAAKQLVTNSRSANSETVRTLRFQPQHFESLSRREEALSKSMLRTLHELERLQRRRAGEPLTAPAVVDVEVEVNHNGSDVAAS
jgi:hypothetical protein